MIRARYLCGLWPLTLAWACGSSPADSTASSTAQSSSSAASSSSGAGGAGGSDAGVPCDDPASLPSASCGALTWSVSPTKARPRNHHVTFLASTKQGAFLYALGGFDSSGQGLANVDRMSLAKDGSIGAPAEDKPLPQALAGLTGGAVGDVLVIAGGLFKSSVSDKSYTAKVQDDGSLSDWKPSGTIVHPRFHGGSFVREKSLYVLGGFDAHSVWDDLVKADVTADGALSAWSSAGKLSGPRSHFSVSFVDGYVFLTGGLDKRETSTPVPAIPLVERGHVLADGTVGEWTPMPPLTVALATHASFFYGGYLYVAGGISGGVNLVEEKRVWRAPIDAAHVLGAWEAVASLPVARGHVHQLPIYADHVYSVAGALDLSLSSTDQIDVGAFL